MPHFVIKLTEQGQVDTILRDGLPLANTLRLEQLYTIVTTYFKGAAASLRNMERAKNDDERRMHGLQSFIFSLTALEAFANVYFHLRANELQNAEIVSRIGQTHGSLTKKILCLLNLCGDGTLTDQDGLINEIFNLTQLRNDLVHPRWTPSSLLVEDTIHIEGLVENRQALLENREFCRFALMLVVLLVARIAEMRNINVEVFVGRWTGIHGLKLSDILEETKCRF